MNSLETIILGIVQGLTEFLPISSSGHLVIFQNLLGFSEPELLLDSALHLGTLVAVCIYFRSDLRKMVFEAWKFDFRKSNESLLLWVIVGTVPTGLIGLIFRSPLESLFGSINMTGTMLIVTGIIIAVTKLIPEEYGKRTSLGMVIALAVGSAQGLAIIPGISRSGATIVCGLLCGLDRDLAARFSFLLSLPAIAGALILQLDSAALERVGLAPLLCGFVCSAVVGLLALRILMGMVRRGRLYYFAPYCWAIGLIIVFLF